MTGRPDLLLRAHVGLGTLLSVVCVALPVGAGRDVLYTVVSFACVGVVVAGVRRHRPREAAGWWLTAAGVATWATADLLWAVYTWVLRTSPFPSPADALYLSSYVLLALGFWRFVRARRRHSDPEGVIDSLIFTVGFVLVSWVVLMRPGLVAAGDSAVGRVLAAAYPLGDVLLLALLVRLLTTEGGRTATFRWLVAGASLLLVADCSYQWVEMTGEYSGGLITLPWLLSYVCIGAAALHPSMRGLTDADPRAQETRFTRSRLLALTLASLVAPGTLLVELIVGARLEAWAVAVASVVLFVLVVARMSGLLRRLDQQAARLTEIARTDALTGLPNRRTVDAELDRAVRRSRSEGLPLCVAVLDLDRFKAFNDTYGHQAGDQLLVQASAAWRARLAQDEVARVPGGSAVLGRWGGEEFLLLLLGSSLGAAAGALESLRQVTPAGQTFSAGLAQWDGTAGAADLFARADAALYAAKAGGRDAVVVAGDTAPSR